MSKPNVRPLIAFSILQLEEAFEAAVLARDDKKIREVAKELECRSVPKAKKLLRRVSDHIEATRKSRQAARKPSPAEPGDGSAMEAAAPKPPKAAPRKKAKAETVPPASAPPAPAPAEQDAAPPEPSRELSSSQTSRPPIRQEPASDNLQTHALDPAKARRVLDAWMLAEILAPYGRYGRPSDLIEDSEAGIADFAVTSDLPWLSGGEGHTQGGLFYRVVVGAIRLDEAAARLFELYGDTKIDGAAPSGFAPIAILTLERDGRPIASEALAISSFAWALPSALKRDFVALAGWTQVRPILTLEAERLLRPAGEVAEPPILTAALLQGLFQHLVEKLELPAELAVAPHFAIRIERNWRGEMLPDSPAVESPYLANLGTAQQQLSRTRSHENLARYLGLKVPSRRIDLRGNDIALADAIAPAKIPPGKWPAGAEQPLVLLQQAAVNLALDGGEASRLLPINGPSGTGKGALLRDLIAALVIKRADAMSEITNPREAFTHIGKVRATDGFTDRYVVSEALKGHEIVIVSSNDALETIVTELMDRRTIDAARTDLRYFGTVADRLFQADAAGPRSWGLLAAALGRVSDLAKLRRAIWDDQEHGLRPYLIEAVGASQSIEAGVVAAKGGQRRKPAVVEVEMPPEKAEALLRWQEAQRVFRSKAKEARAQLDVLERGRQALGERVDPETEEALRVQLTSAGAAVEEARALLANLSAQTEAARGALAEAEQALQDHAASKPSFLRRLVGARQPLAWSQAREQLQRECDDLSEKLAGLEGQLKAAGSRHDEATALLANLRQIAGQLEARKQSVAEAIDATIALSGLGFVDAAFFDRPDMEVQRDTPWLSAEINRLREDLFAAAMGLHRAFVDAAAKPVSSNLDLLFRCFSGNAEWTEKMRPLMPDLWATFCCVIPVIATTFEAVEHWFEALEPEALGWFLIDGAGEIPPQHAVGGLLRAKHAVVIGDPMQLAPVPCLSPGLVEAIAGHLDVDAERFMAPSASVQTLAGGASVFGNTVALGGAWKRQAAKSSAVPASGPSMKAGGPQGLPKAFLRKVDRFSD
ncbi:hypothetical protein GCM10007874_53460 [Labrys miyagiensis]|uniref:AAA domain-containing protein n=1 Tax=Labrys miyagiensis TaxID=346912 RepID=A0ABQ6CRC5_9HYPH|nr:hypothetical protein [Labrys miyagiensis]GLS22328.1 hypothetical protein GCM10007874_53460 [Labrys miyagiensis]